jgi:hypothetical protein
MIWEAQYLQCEYTMNIEQLQSFHDISVGEITAAYFICIGSALSNTPLFWDHTYVELGSVPNTRLKKVTESANTRVYIKIKTVIILNEVSQIQKTKNRTFSLICGL